jgi:multiple sugar transport system substrate-binding protein
LLARHGRGVPAGYTAAELSLFTHNGKLYGFPRDNGTEVIFYNKALFRKAGLPYPKDDWTWDDLRSLARTLTVRTGNRVSQYGFAFETSWWRLYMWENGAELFDSLSHPTKVTFDSPAAIQAIQFMGDLITKDKVTPPAS